MHEQERAATTELPTTTAPMQSWDPDRAFGMDARARGEAQAVYGGVANSVILVSSPSKQYQYQPSPFLIVRSFFLFLAPVFLLLRSVAVPVSAPSQNHHGRLAVLPPSLRRPHHHHHHHHDATQLPLHLQNHPAITDEAPALHQIVTVPLRDLLPLLPIQQRPLPQQLLHLLLLLHLRVLLLPLHQDPAAASTTKRLL